MNEHPHPTPSLMNRAAGFCLKNPFLVLPVLLGVIFWGIYTAPFDWHVPGLTRDPVPVDAIPDIGENQQIVFTQWTGRSPQDVEDQITYPLTVALLGIPDIKTVRGYSMFGFSTIYVTFKESADFYSSRTRILEKLNALPPHFLPEDVSPTLGPDATALGQIFWYTLEGRDPEGHPVGGWNLEELRTIQDGQVRYALQAADGVAEVSSIGGFVREYQVDADPDLLRHYGISITQLAQAIRQSNTDTGARTMEINRVEYMLRGAGFIRSVEDVNLTVITNRDGIPVYVQDVAKVAVGPAPRRGALDKGGIETVGGVAVSRFGAHPLATIRHVKEKISELSAGMPEKVFIDFSQTTMAQVQQFADDANLPIPDDGQLDQTAWLGWARRHDLKDYPAWMKRSKVTLIPFYDRTRLIHETLNTLNTAMIQQVLVTLLVVMVMIRHVRASLLISSLMPMAILGTFVLMKYTGVDAHVIALSGMAIAIGTLVDMGIVMCENIRRHLGLADFSKVTSRDVIYEAVAEVSGAVTTAVAATIVGFAPVFALQASAGKLFRPLAFTITYALGVALLLALLVLPTLARMLLSPRKKSALTRRIETRLPAKGLSQGVRILPWLAIIPVLLFLAQDWLPLGPEQGFIRNALFVTLLCGLFLALFGLFQHNYAALLGIMLNHKKWFALIPLSLACFGMLGWLGSERLLGWIPRTIRTIPVVSTFMQAFPGLGDEFMPSLDEGSFLSMPSAMAHASIGEALDTLSKMDAAIASLPETTSAVGKLGRADSALDPAPLTMFEIMIEYSPEFLSDGDEHHLTFRYLPHETDLVRSIDGTPLTAPDGEPYIAQGRFLRDEQNQLIPDKNGFPFRLWRPALNTALNPERRAWKGIQSIDDLWNEITAVSRIPGSTSSPKMQPIETRLVMLQSGMRAPMGIKITGPDLTTVAETGLAFEKILKTVPALRPETLFSDRIEGKPYIEMIWNRQALAQYGISIDTARQILQMSIGGMTVTTIEGRQRFGVRIRYPRDRCDSLEDLASIMVASPTGARIPLDQLAEITYRRGPQVIKSEDTRLIGYVTFDKQPHISEIDAVQQARRAIEQRIDDGSLIIPPGVSYRFAGTYENQLRAAQTLRLILPITLIILFMIIYRQFSAVSTTLFVFSGIFAAWSGGFILLWLYAQPWFLDFTIWGTPLRDVFHVHTTHLSVAVWVGFLALFGMACNNGVLMATILTQSFHTDESLTRPQIRQRVIEAALLRVRPAIMTTATTLLALLPVLTAQGRGADIMGSMAIPVAGGMLIELITLFIVPVLFCARIEKKFQ
ncbi:MAG: efflux RND transporter permease subunit [Spartobacteria bacterium]|nr:efflux RND transporter permease subunit [Spartobacteria bacterium]